MIILTKHHFENEIHCKLTFRIYCIPSMSGEIIDLMVDDTDTGEECNDGSPTNKFKLQKIEEEASDPGP
jgi:hypothetical protein